MKVQSVLVDLAKNKSVVSQFKSFYRKLKGVFITGLTDNVALVEMKVGSQNIVADSKFPAIIIAATDSLSWREVGWELDKDIDADTIEIAFDSIATNKVFVNFLVE